MAITKLTKSELIDVWDELAGGLPFKRKYIEDRYSKAKLVYVITDLLQ